MWVYKKFEAKKGFPFVVGYIIGGTFNVVKKVASEKEAAKCVNFLNGGNGHMDTFTEDMFQDDSVDMDDEYFVPKYM